jgi:hypothetical protein
MYFKQRGRVDRERKNRISIYARTNLTEQSQAGSFDNKVNIGRYSKPDGLRKKEISNRVVSGVWGTRKGMRIYEQAKIRTGKLVALKEELSLLFHSDGKGGSICTVDGLVPTLRRRGDRRGRRKIGRRSHRKPRP